MDEDENDENELDEAAEESFPASDPPASVQPVADSDDSKDENRDEPS